MGDEPVPYHGAVAPAAELGQAFGGEMVGVAQVIVGQPLAGIAADVEALRSGVLVDEVVCEAQQRFIAHVLGEEPFEDGSVDRRVAFTDVEFHEPSAGALAGPSFDGLARVDGAASLDAGGLPSADLGVQHWPHRVDSDVVEDLVVDRFTADDAVLAADRFDSVEVSDGGVVEAPSADLRRDGIGDAVEVGMVVEPRGHVPPGPFSS